MDLSDPNKSNKKVKLTGTIRPHECIQIGLALDAILVLQICTIGHSTPLKVLGWSQLQSLPDAPHPNEIQLPMVSCAQPTTRR